jgi:hypothetical protein
VYRTAALLAAVVAAACAAGSVAAQEPAVRDPMRPFGGAAAAGGAVVTASGPRFALTGVVIAPSRRIALINGKPQAEGDIVDGAELVTIEPKAVRFRENGTELVISMGRSASARPPIAQGDTVP